MDEKQTYKIEVGETSSEYSQRNKFEYQAKLSKEQFDEICTKIIEISTKTNKQ